MVEGQSRAPLLLVWADRPYTGYTLDANGNPTDSTKYGKNQPVKAYGGWEPRFNMRFNLNENSSIKQA